MLPALQLCGPRALARAASAAASASCASQPACVAQQHHHHHERASSSVACAAVPASTASSSTREPAFPMDASGRMLPHGGSLVSLMVTEAQRRSELEASSTHRMECSARSACDVELLSVGAFSPLRGFMGRDVYEHCLQHARLPGSNLLFGLPVVLDTHDPTIKEGSKVLLEHRGQALGLLEVESRWAPNKVREARLAYGTSSLEHPGVKMLAWERGPWYIGGTLHGFELPRRVFPCATPAEVRATLPPRTDVVVFQCRNPVHRAHYELFTRALLAPNVREGAVCLVHPTCGPTQDDDIPGIVRYRTYEVLKGELADPRVKWAYLPYSMHMAGPREALQHMLLRKNYGCTHFIVGRDMAGSKSCVTGEDFYPMYAAQEFAQHHAAELGMQTVTSLDLVYTEERGYVAADVAKAEGLKVHKISGTTFRKMLHAGQVIPEWFAFRSVVAVLGEYARQRAAQ